jgi:glycosyltransferase involved in cell wall biosynthesis
MKILLVNKFLYPKGGAETVFLGTADVLKARGHEISFFSMAHPCNLPSNFSAYFVSNVDYEKPGFAQSLKAAGRLIYSWESRRNIERLLSLHKPDVAHLHNIYHQISPSIMHSLKKFRVPVVMTLHDYKIVCASYSMVAEDRTCEACKDERYYQCFLKKCVKDSRTKSLLNTFEMYLHHKMLRIYDLVDVFISPSRFLKDKVAGMGFKGRIEVLPNFVDPGDFVPQYGSAEPSVCYVGRLSKEKGVATLMDAMKRSPGVRLKVIGDGPLRAALEKKCRDDGMKNVTFLGYQAGEALKEEIRRSLFLVIPSEWYENNPRAVIEAFALGKPVVGARIGGIPELVRDGETGLTFESGNADDLSEKIRTLVSRPDLIMEMGKKARRFVELELNSEAHYKRLMAIYESVRK